MANAQITQSIIPAYTDMPLDARARVATESDILNIENPYIGLIVYVIDTGLSFIVTALKEKTIGEVTVPNAAVNTYKQLTSSEGAPQSTAAVSSTITLPIPSDDDGHNLTLAVDVSSTGDFTNGDDAAPTNYVRILMQDHYSSMRIFRSGQWVALDSGFIGLSDYGSSVEFTITQEMFPNYVPGNKYYARYTWIDTEGSWDDWIGFSFRGDVADMRPIRLTDNLPSDITDLGDISEPSIALSYTDGEIQRMRLTADVSLDISNVTGVLFGGALILNCDCNGHTLTVTGSSGNTYACTENKTYVIVFTNFGAPQVAITETI